MSINGGSRNEGDFFQTFVATASDRCFTMLETSLVRVRMHDAVYEWLEVANFFLLHPTIKGYDDICRTNEKDRS